MQYCMQDSWNDMVQCDGYDKTEMKCVQMSPFTSVTGIIIDSKCIIIMYTITMYTEMVAYNNYTCIDADFSVAVTCLRFENAHVMLADAWLA